MASETINQTQSTTPKDQPQEMEPLITKCEFADEELNHRLQYNTSYWDTFQLTTFDAYCRPGYNDREWWLFKYDGYYYNQVWRGYISHYVLPSNIKLRGVIESPDGKSFVIIGTDGHVFVLKRNSYKSGPLLEGARFSGLGKIFYSPTTRKYYGVLTKRASKNHEFPRLLTFAEINLNFTKSGDLPEDPTYIKQVVTRLFSFEDVGDDRTTTQTFADMHAPDMLISNFSEFRSVEVKYINYDAGWKNHFDIDDVIEYPLHFDLANCRVRALPAMTTGQFISVDPENPREMLYVTKRPLNFNKGNELYLLSASDTGIEIDKTIPFPFIDYKVVNYCIIIDHTTQQKYYWDYATRNLIGIRPNRIGPQVSSCSIPGVVYLAERRSIKLFPLGILDKLAAAGGNLPWSVSSIISKFLAVKYK